MAGDEVYDDLVTSGPTPADPVNEPCAWCEDYAEGYFEPEPCPRHQTDPAA